MDLEEKEDHFATFSWWSDGHNIPYQSPWLQHTISDLDKNVKRMVNIIHDDGETFAKRAEMFHKRKPELIDLVSDLHNSYRALASKYEKLRSEMIRVSQSPSSSANQDPTHHRVLIPWADHSIYNAQLSFFDPQDRAFIRPENELLSSNEAYPLSRQILNDDETSQRVGCCGLERKRMQEDLNLTVSRLVEENMEQQAELIKRNDEKRGEIKHLHA